MSGDLSHTKVVSAEAKDSARHVVELCFRCWFKLIENDRVPAVEGTVGRVTADRGERVLGENGLIDNYFDG